MEQINEVFTVAKAQFKKKDGTYCPVVYIDPSSSENTYPVKDKLKAVLSKYGGLYSSAQHVWLWFLPKDKNQWQSYIDSKVRPCVAELNQIVSQDEVPATAEEVAAMIDEILAAPMESRDNLNSLHQPIMDEQELKQRLEELKVNIMTKMSGPEFAAYLKKVLEFSSRQGFEYSFLNSLLIMLQDPDATLVRNKSCWRDVYHRQVKENAPAICLWKPHGGRRLYPDKASQAAFTADYLKKVGVDSVDKLNGEQADYLYHELKRSQGKTGFRFEALWFDVRFTEQIPGMSEVPIAPQEDVAWAEKRSAEATETSVRLVDAISDVIEQSGLKLEVAKNLGGALGLCISNGTIKTLDGSKKNISLAQTLIHEFGHALLHQDFLSKNNPELAEYYNGIKNTNIKEQQAEVLAYIVLGYFGIDATLSTAVYASTWGLTPKTAVDLFNSLCKVSNMVYSKIKAVLDRENTPRKITEALINETHLLNGRELADMLGMAALYQQGIEYEKGEDGDPENSMRVMKESFNRLSNFK